MFSLWYSRYVTFQGLGTLLDLPGVVNFTRNHYELHFQQWPNSCNTKTLNLSSDIKTSFEKIIHEIMSDKGLMHLPNKQEMYILLTLYVY